jgi:hypothetical protein
MKTPTLREEINSRLSIYFLRGLKGEPKEIYRQFRWMAGILVLMAVKLHLLLMLAENLK